MTEEKFNRAKNWFENLREEIINVIEKIDGEEFNISDWHHKSGGGGKMSKIIGNVFEKGGVNISSVSGKFNDEMTSKIPGAQNNHNYKVINGGVSGSTTASGMSRLNWFLKVKG